MDCDSPIRGFLHLVTPCGREERFTFTVFLGDGEELEARLVAWLPGAIVPIVREFRGARVLGTFRDLAEEHGAPVSAVDTAGE